MRIQIEKSKVKGTAENMLKGAIETKGDLYLNDRYIVCADLKQVVVGKKKLPPKLTIIMEYGSRPLEFSGKAAIQIYEGIVDNIGEKQPIVINMPEMPKFPKKPKNN